MTNAAHSAAPLAVLLCLGVTGCAAPNTSSAPSSPLTTPTQIASAPPSAQTLPWTLVSAQDRSVVISTRNKGCLNPDAVTSSESQDTVTITVIGRAVPEPCAAVGISVNVTVHLDAPIDNRKIEGGQQG